MSLTEAQKLLDDKYPKKYKVIPSESVKMALGFYEDKMTTALLGGRNKGNVQFFEAGIARLFMTQILGIEEKAISKAIGKAEERVEKIKKRVE